MNRLLLCCSTCPAVAHLKCAGLRLSPDEEVHCASCLRSAALVPVPAAAPAHLPAALPVAMPAAPAALPADMPVPLPAPLPAILPAALPAAVPAAPVARSRVRPRTSVPSSGPTVAFAVDPIPAPVASESGRLPLRSSSRLLARAAPDLSSDLSARTGQGARLGVLFARSSVALAFLAYVRWRWPVALRHAFRLWAVGGCGESRPVTLAVVP